jgi:hypothetical protein
MFTLLICVVLTINIIGIAAAKILHPDVDLSKGADAIFNMLSTIIGALVGFISGRAYGRREEREQLNGDQSK